MKRLLNYKLVWFLVISVILLTSTVFLSISISAMQKRTEEQIVYEETGAVTLDNNEEIPIKEGVPGLYNKERTVHLMPIDLTLERSDIPELMDKFTLSDYKAIYLDDSITLVVTKDGVIRGSTDNRQTWVEYTADSIDSADFADWLLVNDPNPGYSMDEMQNRLSDGAVVRHLKLSTNAEMYFVEDESGLQIELVQLEKIESILIDNKRMMLTSETYSPYKISKNLLQEFFDLIFQYEVMTRDDAANSFDKLLLWLEENNDFIIQ